MDRVPAFGQEFFDIKMKTPLGNGVSTVGRVVDDDDVDQPVSPVVPSSAYLCFLAAGGSFSDALDFSFGSRSVSEIPRVVP